MKWKKCAVCVENFFSEVIKITKHKRFGSSLIRHSDGSCLMDWLGSGKRVCGHICHLCTCGVYCNKNRYPTPTSAPSVPAAGIRVDELVMQLVGLRYTEPDMTISYPGFLYLLMKLESMIRKRGWCGAGWGCKHCYSFLSFRGDEWYKLETASGFNHHICW